MPAWAGETDELSTREDSEQFMFCACSSGYERGGTPEADLFYRKTRVGQALWAGK